jgi:hypothetical protein
MVQACASDRRDNKRIQTLTGVYRKTTDNKILNNTIVDDIREIGCEGRVRMKASQNHVQ